MAEPLHLGKEERAAGYVHRQGLGVAQPGQHAGDCAGCLLVFQLEDHKLVGGVAISGDLARVGQVIHDLGNLRGVLQPGHGEGHLTVEVRIVDGEGGAVEEDHEGAGPGTDGALDQFPGSHRLHPLADETAELEVLGCLRKERERNEDEQNPGGDYRPPAPVSEKTE